MKRRVYVRWADDPTPIKRLPKVPPKQEELPEHWKLIIEKMPKTERQEFGELLREIKAHAPGVFLKDTVTLQDLRDLVYSVTRCQVFRL